MLVCLLVCLRWEGQDAYPNDVEDVDKSPHPDDYDEDGDSMLRDALQLLAADASPASSARVGQGG